MSTSTSAFFSVLKGWLIQFKPLHEKGLSYTSINIARCTFSAILDPCGVSRTSSLVSTQISRGSWKAFFTECRLPQPRYNKSWDVYIVLQHILSMDESNKLPTQRLYQETSNACDLNYSTKRPVNTSNGHLGCGCWERRHIHLWSVQTLRIPTKSPSEPVLLDWSPVLLIRNFVVDTCSVYSRHAQLRAMRTACFLHIRNRIRRQAVTLSNVTYNNLCNLLSKLHFINPTVESFRS